MTTSGVDHCTVTWVLHPGGEAWYYLTWVQVHIKIHSTITGTGTVQRDDLLTQFTSDDRDKCNGNIKNLYLRGSQHWSESPSSSLKGSSRPGPCMEGFDK